MTVFDLMSQFGFTPIVVIIGMIAALGAYKFVKDWLPW